MISIAIVDDKKPLRNMLSEKIHEAGKFHVLFTAENGIDFLDKMKEPHRIDVPDIVLMDIDMPIMDGIEAVRQGKMRYPQTNYLMLTIFDEDEKIFNAIRAGASGYLLKDEPINKIKEAISQLMNEESAPMSPSIARRTLHLLMSVQIKETDSSTNKQNLNNYSLSNREKEVLALLVEGFEYKEIALKMNVSPNTIRNHIANIYKKLHVSSKVQAIRLVVGEQ